MYRSKDTKEWKGNKKNERNLWNIYVTIQNKELPQLKNKTWSKNGQGLRIDISPINT
jgi:hypothetical protein